MKLWWREFSSMIHVADAQQVVGKKRFAESKLSCQVQVFHVDSV